jgi:hypothetical protein
MLTDGKFITYGITFDVGKSTLKPESMGEINRIVKLVTDNPDLKFSVEGHTDATGNAASNQTLSDTRSKAVVDKLVEMGVAADRLASAGKGQNLHRRQRHRRRTCQKPVGGICKTVSAPRPHKPRQGFKTLSGLLAVAPPPTVSALELPICAPIKVCCARCKPSA